jgi:VWFA-related protein
MNSPEDEDRERLSAKKEGLWGVAFFRMRYIINLVRRVRYPTEKTSAIHQKKGKVLLLCLAMCLSFGWSGFLPGSYQASKNQKALQYEVAVTLKLVQVYVTDKKGKPVVDLKKSDFVLYDNGVLQEVTDLEKHIISEQALRTEARPVENIAASPLPEAEKMSRKFFLIFDFAYNSFIGVTKAKKAGLHFIDTHLLPTDEVAILSYSALKSLTLHEYLTTDHNKVREAVDAVDKGQIGGRAFEIEEQYWKNRDFDYMKTRVEGNEVVSVETERWKLREVQEQERTASKNQALNFLNKMTDLAKAMRYIPGQKNIVLFSSGIPASMLYGTGQPVGKAMFDFGDSRLRAKSEELLKEFSSSNCIVFSFDTREKDVNLFRDDKETFITGDRRIMLDARSDTITFRDGRTVGEASLRRLSSGTGGKYFGNIDEYQRHIQRLQDLTGSYYILGYYIDEKWDGQYHTIKLEVRRKGCEVHSQSGYFNPKPFREYSLLEKKLHLMDLALSAKPFLQTPHVVSLVPLAFSAPNESHLFLLSEIPAKILEKFPGKTAEAVALVFDEQGNLAKIDGIEFEIAKLRGKNVICFAGTALRPGRYQCCLVLRDLDTGEAAVARGSVFIAKPLEKSLVLYQPLLLVPMPGSVYLGEQMSEKKSCQMWKDAYSFDSRALTPLIGPLPKGTSKILALIPFSQMSLSQAAITYKAHLVNLSSRQDIPVACAELERMSRQGFQAQSLELELGELQPGEYVLYILARDSSTKESSYVQTTLVVQ